MEDKSIESSDIKDQKHSVKLHLNGANYATWENHIRRELQNNHVWDIVQIDPGQLLPHSSASERRFRRKQIDRANAIIVNSLELPVLRELVMGASSWSLWQALDSRYRQGEYGLVLNKAFEYMECKYDCHQGASMWKHIGRMEELVQSLASMGLVIPEPLQSIFLVHSVTTNSNCRALLYDLKRRDEPPSKEEIIQALLTRCGRYNSHSMSDVCTSSSTAASSKDWTSDQNVSSQSTSNMTASGSSNNADFVTVPVPGTAAMMPWCPYCMKPTE